VVVVADDELGLEVLVGFKEAQPLSAASTVGFEVSLTLGRVVVVPLLGVVVDVVDPFSASDTPCSVRQLRYAATAVLFAPPFPPKPAPVPFGRRLAHALSAVWKLGFPDAAPAPAVGAPPDPLDVGVTPFFSRQERNAVADAVPEEDEGDEEDEDGAVVVVVVVELEELATPPHAAARRPTATIATPTLRRRRFFEDVARRHVRWSGVTSLVCSRVLMAAIVARRAVLGLHGSCRFFKISSGGPRTGCPQLFLKKA